MQIIGTIQPHYPWLLLIPLQWLAAFSSFLLSLYYTEIFIKYIKYLFYILELISDSTLTLLQHPSSFYRPPFYASHYPIFLVTLVSLSLAFSFSPSAYEQLLFDCARPLPLRVAIVLIFPIPYFVPLFAL